MIPLADCFLEGSYTPLVTPFREDGAVDLDAYARLVERQVERGSHGIVVTGTTGEPASLTVEERAALARTAVGAARGRVPVVAATGSQSLAETLTLTEDAERAGADAVLVVTPYYVRPPQSGLVEYFAAVGGSTRLPLLVYNIPGRTAVAIGVDALARIAERVPTLVGIKHAAPDLDFVTEVLRSLGNDFRVFCGLEALSLPMLAVGARGVMNAVGNLVPERVAALCDAANRGELGEARRIHVELFELNSAIFFDTNPIPLKWMMNRLGLLERADVRLPLVTASAETQAKCEAVLRRAGLVEDARAAVATKAR